jgi:hypothetical protein
MATMQEDPREVIERCLKYVNGEDREPYVAVGQCIHSAIPTEEGFRLWIDWARGWPKFHEGNARSDWKSFKIKAGGRTLGTLMKMALDAGMPPLKLAGSAEPPPRSAAPKPSPAPPPPTIFPTIPSSKQGFYKVDEFRYTPDWVVVRYEKKDWTPSETEPKRPKIFGQYKRVPGGWEPGSPPAPRPLYRDLMWLFGNEEGSIEMVEPLPSNDPLFLVEGENCVRRLHLLGLDAATCANGADGIASADWGIVKGREVRLWPDNDKAGRGWAEKLAKVVEEAGAKSVALVRPYSSKDGDAETKEDVIDYLNNHPESTMTTILNRECSTISAGSTTTSLVDGFLQNLRDRHAAGNWGGLTLGHEWKSVDKEKGLDEMLWGLRGLIFLGAAPGAGKTQLALQLVEAVLDSNPDTAVIFYNLEMPRDEIAARWISYRSGLKYRDLLMPDPTITGPRGKESGFLSGTRVPTKNRQAIESACARVRSYERRVKVVGKVPGSAREGGERGGWGEAMLDEVSKFKAESGAKRVFVVIDNFQAIDIEMPNKTSDLDRDRETVEGITRLQRGMGLGAVLCISELRKDNFSFVSGMGDLLGSGRLPYRADTVMLLHYRKMIPLGKAKPGSEKRAYKHRHPQELTLTISKTRDGGHRGTVDLWWDEHFSKLLTVSTITPDERAKIDQAAAKAEREAKNWKPPSEDEDCIDEESI